MVEIQADGDGLRVSKTLNGITSRGAWDTAEGAAQILDDGTSQYVWGPGHIPVERVTAGVATYLHTDTAGDVRTLTSPTGLVGTLADQAQADTIAANLSGEADVSVQGALDTIRTIVNNPGEALSSLADNVSAGARAALDQARITIAEVNNSLDEIPGLRNLMNLSDAKTALTDVWTCATSSVKKCAGNAAVDGASYLLLKGMRLDDANALGFSMWLTSEGVTDALTESFDRLNSTGKAGWCNGLGFH